MGFGSFAALAGGLAGGIAGYNDAKKTRAAHDRSRNRGDKILGVWDEHDQGGEFGKLQEAGGLFGIRRDYMQQLLDNAAGAFDSARGSAKRGSEKALKSARSSGIQSQADATQNLQNMGLTGGTIAEQARANVNYQTGETVANIQTQLGDIMSGLDLQESATMDQVLRGNLALEEMNAEQMMAYIVGNTGHGVNDSSMFFRGKAEESDGGFNPFDTGYGVENAFKDIAGLFGGSDDSPVQSIGVF